MADKDILSRMTIEEKLNWTSGHGMWSFLGNERLGIREIFLADGPHGLRAYTNVENELALALENLAETTLFPSATAMASTFNEELIYNVGKSIGKECNMFDVDVLLGPGVNLKRSPLGGRNFEYYSEDPYLTGRIATNFIKGVQSTKVGACIKHFALNEQETNRRFVNTIVDERTMHELYLAPFKMAIKEANPMAIMSSYNKVNGDYASESSILLKDILRDKWGFKGVVISDWGAVQDKPKSLRNGMNIEMPGPSEFDNETRESLENGTLLESDIDESLLPLLELEELTKLNDNKDLECSLQEHHDFSRKVSEEAIVLLENDGILPFKGIKNLGIIGAFAKEPRINGGGSATLKPFITEIPFDELEKEFTLEYAKGYEEERTNELLLDEVKNVCLHNETVVYFTGTTKSLEVEGKDREHMNLPKGHIDVFNVIKEYAKNIVVVLMNGSAINVSPLKGHVNALVEAWMLGGSNATAIVNTLVGKNNPSGRLSETFPVSIESTPYFGLFPSKQDDVYYHGDIINTGYKYYDTHNVEVAYPFGYGLSYSNFLYKSIEVNKEVMTNKETLSVKVVIENDSDVDGYEVVQLYVRDQESYYPRPKKELKAFKKVFVKANTEVEVLFELDEDAFSIYAVDYKEFRVEEGYFDILVGRNVQKIELKETIFFKTKELIRNSLTLAHPLKNFFIYKPQSVEYIRDQFRDFPWHEIEEPALRVLKRVKKEFEITDVAFQKMLDKLLE